MKVVWGGKGDGWMNEMCILLVDNTPMDKHFT